MAESTPTDMPPELAALFEAMMAGAAVMQGEGPTVQEIAEQYPKIVAGLAKFDPVEAVAAFGALLTMPELQASCFRIEVLVHLTLLTAKGREKPTDAFARSAYRALDEGFCGRMEDPAEDVFVGAVRTPRGNFRVLEGLWEGNAYFLQRFINVIEDMPEGSGYDELRDCAYALLMLSDLVCERAGLTRFQLGAEVPPHLLNQKVLGSLNSKARRVKFSLAELEEAGIDPPLLAPFLFRAEYRERALSEQMHRELS